MIIIIITTEDPLATIIRRLALFLLIDTIKTTLNDETLSSHCKPPNMKKTALIQFFNNNVDENRCRP
jgi:hypothetical protein